MEKGQGKGTNTLQTDKVFTRKEYIEREALIDEINIAPVSMSICMNVDECKGRIYERERLVRIINEATAADVVPVVRCKDCEYWDRETIRQNSNDAGWWNEAICKEHTIYGNEHRDVWTSAEWYCASGARMDGDGE